MIVSFWGDLLSGAMLVLGSVSGAKKHREMDFKPRDCGGASLMQPSFGSYEYIF